MQVISDLPPHVIDQIIGNPDSSFVVIRLWLCGDKIFNDKLSKGVTLIDLKSHPLSTSTVPRIISQLRSLRHIKLYSSSGLVKEVKEWPGIMRSLPNTLESLAIHSYSDCGYCLLNWSEYTRFNYINYPRGESDVIELETLFPCLHTLTLASTEHATPSYGPSLFPALPTSLTRLEAAIELYYDSPSSSYLSQLPPNIVHMTGPISWTRDDDLSEDEFFETIRRDFANAPPSLETFKPGTSQPWAKEEDVSSSFAECWLPKSILEVDYTDYSCPHWSPSLARTLPQNLHTLSLGDINMDSFDDTHTNWIADLPRSLTKLFSYAPHSGIDFVRYAQYLPPKLADLTLVAESEESRGISGDWSTLPIGNSAVSFWPSTLTSLTLTNFWIEPSEIANLPGMITSLVLSVSTTIEVEDGEPLPSFETSQFPPNLTYLRLEWTSNLNLVISAKKLVHLKSCRLTLKDEELYDEISVAQLSNLPSSLRFLHLHNLGIESPLQDDLVLPLPNLRRLEARHIDYEMFELLPRSLIYLDVIYLYNISESPLLAEGHLFKHLPPSLKYLLVKGKSEDLPKDFELAAQRFDHLPALLSLCLACTPNMSSKMLRAIPRSILVLKLSISELNEDDLPYLPPRLYHLFIPKMTPALAKCMSLRSLASLNKEVSDEIVSIAKNRVRQAAVHQ